MTEVIMVKLRSTLAAMCFWPSRSFTITLFSLYIEGIALLVSYVAIKFITQHVHTTLELTSASFY